MTKKTDNQSKNPSNKIRSIDLLTDEVMPWWKKSYVFVGKKEVATWKGALILTFVAGVAVAIVWSAKSENYDTSEAAAASTLYFNPATVTTTVGSSFSLVPTINTGVNAVSAIEIHITYDQTKLRLDSINCASSGFSNALYAPAIAGDGIVRLDCAVSAASPSITSASAAIATANFTALSAVANSPVSFTAASGAAADGEAGNVITTRIGAIVTVNNVSDTTAPNGGSISYTNGYLVNTAVALTAADGTDAVSGIDTASRIVQRRSATLSAGNCGTYGSWGVVTQTGTYPNFTDATVTGGNCYQYRYLVSDSAPTPNQAIYTSANVSKVDTAAPTGGSISYNNGYLTSTSIALTAADGTDAASGINTAIRIVQRRSATLSAGTCGTYGSWGVVTPTGTYPNFTDATAASGNCYQYQYLVVDNATNQATYTSTNVAKIDTAGPLSGSIAYANGYNRIRSISLTAADGSDAVSGINTGSRTIQRRSAASASGTCGTYGSWGSVTLTGTYPNYADATVVSGNCYQYRYLIFDNAANQTTLTSANIVKATYLSDISTDGAVNIYDYNILHTNFASTACGNTADIIVDCSVDIYDYNQLHADYGKSM